MTERHDIAVQKTREAIEREVHEHPAVKELLEKHGARIREIKILKPVED